MRNRFSLLSGVLVAVLAVFCAASIFGQDVSFIGLAVAEEITEDDNGLTVLSGLFNMIQEAEEFPFAHDLWIYTRWAGSGDHSVLVRMIGEDMDEPINESESDLSLEKDSVSYISHDFNNTVFTGPGVYWIEVELDGELVAEAPFYVNTTDESGEDPMLLLSTPATDAYYREDDLTAISGVFEYFIFKRFPAADDFILANAWLSGDGEYEEYCEIVDPDGKVIGTSEPQSFSGYPGEIAVLRNEFQNFIFKKQGQYMVNVYLDGDQVFEYPLRVTKQE